jgi:membrane protease YdiL (CAAX protease family)
MNPTTSDEIQEPRRPHWNYLDLAFFVGAVVPALSLAFLLVQGVMVFVPKQAAVKSSQALIFQGVAVTFLLGALYFVVAWRYGAPFWRSLGWRLPIPHAALLLAAGPVMAIGLGALGVALKMGGQPSEIDEMITGRTSLLIWAFYGVAVAPVFEELVFRGFLYPLFARNLGPWGGIICTALPFGLLHGAQNHWAWQSVLLISVAGGIFGFVRYKTHSTAASFLLHAAYNAAEFGLFGIAHWGEFR